MTVWSPDQLPTLVALSLPPTLTTVIGNLTSAITRSVSGIPVTTSSITVVPASCPWLV